MQTPQDGGMYWANAQNLPELPPVSCHGRLPLEGCKPRGPERDPPAPSCPVQGFPSTLPRKVCPTGPQGGTPQGGFRVAWRGRPTSSWETRGTSVVGLGVGSGRGWWSAGDSRFPPPSHRVSAHRAKGAEAAHWTPGCCSCLLTPLPWRPPGRPSRPRAFVLAVPPPRSPLLALASLCHPVLSWGPLLWVCWGALPLPSAPSPPLLSAGWEAVCGLARLFSPWDPEWRFVSCPGLCPSARGRPRTQRHGSGPEEKPGPGPGGRESLTPAGGRPLCAPIPCWLLGPVPAGLGRGRGRASSAGWGGLSVRGEGRDWLRGAGRVPFPAPGSHWGQAAGPAGALDCHVDAACTLPFLHACSGNELFPPPLLDSFPGGRAVGGEAAWGPGVALELRSLPRAVPSPGQAPSHTPTPPAPPGPRSPGAGGVGLLGCSQSQLCPQP